GGPRVTSTVKVTPPSTGSHYASIVVNTQSSEGKTTNSPSSSAAMTVTMSATGVSSISVTVSPTSATIQTGGQQQFSASVSGTSNTAVVWTASGGSVSTG